MFPGPLRGFIALSAFGDEAFDFAPLFLRVDLSLHDFARQEENALISHLKNNRGAFFKVEDTPDRSRYRHLSLRRHFSYFNEFHAFSLHSYILTIPPLILIVNNNILMTPRRQMDSQLDPGFTTKGFPWREKVGTSPQLSHDRKNLGLRTHFKGIGYTSMNSFDFLKELSKSTRVIEYILINMSYVEIRKDLFISTNQQKVLSFLAKFSDQEYHEREIARKVGISYGSANRVLNDLAFRRLLMRRQVGKMLFYSFNQSDPIFKPFKIFISIALLRPLIDKLRSVASEVVLYGSCARGEDASKSDVDLFIISEDKEEALRLRRGHRFLKGFDHLKIESVILSAVELLKSEKDDKEFLSLVREGIVLWDKTEDEAGIKAIVR